MEAKSKIAKRVCCVANEYGLLEYLLVSSLEEWNSTFFFFPEGFRTSVAKEVGPHHVFIWGRANGFLRVMIPFCWLFLRFFKFVRWPFLGKADVYAQDHFITAWMLLSGIQYHQLEDGYGTYHPSPRVARGFFSRVLHMLDAIFLWPRSHGSWGMSAACTDRILCHIPKEGSFLRDKPYRVYDMNECWYESSDEKKLRILKVFNVSQDVLKKYAGCTCLLMTQPFSEAGQITEQEKIDCYKNIISFYKLSKEELLIKTHPFEKTDYRSYFPGFKIMTEKVPVEIMVFCGASYKKVFVVSSTGAFLFSGSSSIEWCGSRFSKALNRSLGEIACPIKL